MIIKAWQRPDLSEDSVRNGVSQDYSCERTVGPLLKPSEAAPGSRDNGAGADYSRLVKASQAEAGPGASAPLQLEPPAAAAADEK